MQYRPLPDVPEAAIHSGESVESVFDMSLTQLVWKLTPDASTNLSKSIRCIPTCKRSSCFRSKAPTTTQRSIRTKTTKSPTIVVVKIAMEMGVDAMATA
jgi:hypothetical protein